MTTIISNQAANIAVTLMMDGVAVLINPAATVTAQLFNIQTGVPLFTPAKVLSSTDIGSSWSSGLVAVALSAGDTASTVPPDAMLAIVVNGKPYRFRIIVEVANAAPTKSALFIKDFVVNEIRADRLYAVAEGLLPGVSISDDYIWNKVVAAEAEIGRSLRVKLVPTAIFSTAPTQDQIDALAGMPWEEDSAYDYDPEMYAGDRWGFIQTRWVPVISVSKMRYAYPTDGQGQVYDIPLDWLKLDKKYGHLRIVPMSTSIEALMNPWLLQILSAGRMIPNMINLTYVTGLVNAARDYPELLDVIKKSAVLKVIEDGFLPQSGSISADGLSQSMSTDVNKYHDMIDRTLTGAPGTNGGLMAAIHGIRLAVA